MLSRGTDPLSLPGPAFGVRLRVESKCNADLIKRLAIRTS